MASTEQAEQPWKRQALVTKPSVTSLGGRHRQLAEEQLS